MDYSKALVNGRTYEWCDIRTTLLGVTLVGIQAINYSDNMSVEDIYGAGCVPVARAGGRYEATASIRLLMDEVEALQDAAPGGRIQAIPEFDIIVEYLPKDGKKRKHVIKNCRFVNNVREVETQQTSIPVELEIKTSHIKWRD